MFKNVESFGVIYTRWGVSISLSGCIVVISIQHYGRMKGNQMLGIKFLLIVCLKNGWLIRIYVKWMLWGGVSSKMDRVLMSTSWRSQFLNANPMLTTPGTRSLARRLNVAGQDTRPN